MPTVEPTTRTIIRRSQLRAISAINQFHHLLQEYGEDDIRAYLGTDANDTIIDTCRLLFGAQISLFEQEVPHNPNQ